MKKFAWVLVLAAAVLWGTMGFWVRGLNALGLNTLDIVALRSVGSVLVATPALLGWRPALLRVKPTDLWCFVGTGLLSVVFFNYCYFQTIAATSLSTAAVLLYTSPIFVMLLSRLLFGEKLTLRKGAAVVLAFGGCMLVNLQGGSAVLTPMGLLTGLGAGFGYALYSIFSRFALMRGYHPLTITYYTFVFASVGMLPVMVMRAGTLAAAAGQPTFWLLTVGLVLLVSLLSYILYTSGLAHMETGRAAVLATIEPVAATLMGVVLYGEALTPLQLLGIAAVLGSGFLV